MTSAVGGGSIAFSRAVKGIDDTTSEHGYSISPPSREEPTTAVARPPWWRILSTLVSKTTLEPWACTSSVHFSHI